MLPGKLYVGILEEDNPLKSYFRLKPVLIFNEGKYEPFTDGDSLPSEGCLRIVPDKNESGRFKARMRRMGRYCLLDLRGHPILNEKIRANKNFGAIPGENNANIVYSDVVREPVNGMILDIATDSYDETITTEEVLIGDSLDIYRLVSEATGENTRLVQDGTLISESDIARFELPGIGDHMLKFAVRISEAYLPPVPGAEHEPVQRNTAAINPEMPKPAAEPENSAVNNTEPEKSIAENVKNEPEPAVDHPVKAVENNCGGAAIKQLFSSQMGLNPRRRMSLQEIIDDKWCRSREDQLGHPITGSGAGQPMESPVDRAINAIRESWNNPETRKQLTDSILGMSDIAESLDSKLISANESAARHTLDTLEAERLMALAEIDKLRKEKSALRETFKAEIRVDEANALKDAISKTKNAQEQLDQLNARIAATRADADALSDVLASLKDGRFENELRSFALKNRCIDMIMRLRHDDLTPSAVPETAPGHDEWLQRAKSAFSARGLSVNEKELTNYLVCLALSNNVILSGASGSDRQLTCDAIAETLSADTAKQYLKFAPHPHPPMPPRPHDELPGKSEIAGIILIQNANLEPHIAPAVHKVDNNRITVFDVSDTGLPIQPEILEDSWFIRIAPVSEDAPWFSRNSDGSEALPTASMKSLRDAFLSDLPELPEQIVDRMASLRRALADYGVFLSRKALNDMWEYCGAMSKVCVMTADEAFDRAFAQRALPGILATAPISCLKALSDLLKNMPASCALLKQPLPIGI